MLQPRKRSPERRRPAVGARPGELVAPTKSAPAEIQVFDYGPELCQEWRPSAEELDATSKPEGARVRWVDVHGLSDVELLQRLAESFEIHPLALADVVNVPQRAKVDPYENNHLLILRMVRALDDGSVAYEQVSMIVGEGWLLTVQEQVGDVFEPLRTRLREKLGNVRTMGADYLAYALLDAVVDAYFPVADRIASQFEELEREIIEDGGDRDDLNRIHSLRGELRDFDRPVRQMQKLLSTLLQSDQSPIAPDVRVWLRDVYDHVLQVRELLDRQRDFATALMELHLSTANNKMNEVMKVLTVIASIFIPLTFIASIYGMNFQNMPELGTQWGYPAVLSVMAAIGVGLYLLFRRRDWL